jgi:broad specificity phosphatase PhoE
VPIPEDGSVAGVTSALLVRHGQSEWNALGRWQGQADPPLTDLGRAQARHAARSVGSVGAIVASDLQRAAETATILSAELGVGPVVVDPDLRERDAGAWSGLTRVEIDERFPGYLQPHPDEGEPTSWAPRRPPGWESDDALLARAVAALRRVHDLVPDGTAVVVTHGGLVYTVEEHLGAHFERIANLEGRWVELGPDGPVRLGERVPLIEPDERTVPAQI